MTNDNLINDAFDNGINENNRDEVNSIVREKLVGPFCINKN